MIVVRRVQRVQSPGVSSQLLHSTGAEGVARSYQHGELVLDQPEADLGQVGRLPNLKCGQFYIRQHF